MKKTDTKILIILLVLSTPILEKTSTCYTCDNLSEFITCESSDFDPYDNIYHSQLMSGSMSW